MIETLHLVETVAPHHLQVDQYLPAHVVRSLILPDGTNIAEKFKYQSFEEEQVSINSAAVSKIIDSQASGIKSMLSSADKCAESYLHDAAKSALATMNTRMDAEINRLHQLAEINPNVRQDEIDYFVDIKSDLTAYISNASCRLDAIRVLITS